MNLPAGLKTHPAKICNNTNKLLLTEFKTTRKLRATAHWHVAIFTIWW